MAANITKKVTGFQAYLTSVGHSSKKVKEYTCTVNNFLVYLKNTKIKNVDYNDILDYYNYLKTKISIKTGNLLSDSVIHHEIYALRTFYKYLEIFFQVKNNPLANFALPKCNYAEREILTKKEIFHAFETAGSFENAAILHLFYSCGLRRSEAANLNCGDINFNKRFLCVRKGKGGYRRTVPFSINIAHDLKAYYIQERTNKSGPSISKFGYILNEKGTRMRGNTFNIRVKRIMREAGINKKISLHNLRHTIATHLIENGMRFEDVSAFLGHKQIDCTGLYTHLNYLKAKGI